MELSSELLYGALIAAVSAERGFELLLSRRNAAWALARGGKEYGAGHFPFMAVLHTSFLVACLAEVWLLERTFRPVLGWPMLLLALVAQALRYWAIRTLGRRWNVKIIVLPEAPAVDSGPYRWVKHPNYLAVIIEGLALPLVHGAWITAGIFSMLNAGLLSVRIRCEEQALSRHNRWTQRMKGRSRFLPGL